MGVNESLVEQIAIVATIDPDAYGTGDQTSDIIDMRYFREVLFLLAAGDMGTNATIDFIVRGSAAANMAGAAAVTGKSIIQLTQASTDSDKQVIVRVSAEEAAAQSFRYIQATMTVATAACDAGMIAIASGLRYSAGSDFDLASVDEVVL